MDKKRVIWIIIGSFICILILCLFCPLVHPTRFQSSEFDHVYIRSDCFGSENQWEMDSKDTDCIAEVAEILNEVRMSYFEKYFLSYEPGNMTPEMTIVLYHGKKDILIDCYEDILCFERQDVSGEEKTDGQHKFWSVDRFAGRVNEIIRKYGEISHS